MDNLEWLRHMEQFYRMQNAPASTLHFKDAADELEELREAVKNCPVGPCPVLAHMGLKNLV
jgi:hypothetical protein